MIGIWANPAAIIVGGLLGCLLRGGIREKYKATINYGLALCVMIIGISGALKNILPGIRKFRAVTESGRSRKLRIAHYIPGEHLHIRSFKRS